jgi:hypothetical protein
MEIEYQNTKADFIEFGKSFLIKRIQKGKILVFSTILVISLAAGLTGTPFNWFTFAVSFAIFSIFYFVVNYLFPLFKIHRQTDIKLKDQSSLEKKRMIVGDEGIKVESESKTSFFKWESIKKVNSNNKFIWLGVGDKRSILLSKKYFVSEDQATSFLGHIQIMIIKTNGASTSSNIEYHESSQRTANTSISDLIERSKPPYLLGLLCIIPLVGAFVGFGLLMYGIFKYKDKWLVIIGAAGIVWTIYVYSSLNYDRNSKEVRDGLAKSSQMEINGLMKDIEFYKLKNSVYPDSLEQISQDDQMVSIIDPLQAFGSDKKKNTKFNYQKVGNHYYLYSSGLDGIPNTNDDIYPQVAASDSSKFGLIRK